MDTKKFSLCDKNIKMNLCGFNDTSESKKKIPSLLSSPPFAVSSDDGDEIDNMYKMCGYLIDL